MSAMGFHIKRDSLPRIIAKSFLIAVVVVPAAFFSLVILFSVVIDKDWPTFLEIFPKVLSTLLLTLSQELPVFLALLLAPFISFLPAYLRRNDRLLIGDHGIRFDSCFWPFPSWHIAWQDLQLPITHHVPSGTLYFQLNRPDDSLLPDKKRWYSFLFVPIGNRAPHNAAFKLDMVRAWRTGHHVENQTADAGAVKADKRPIVVREIERRLGESAIKKTFFLSPVLADQARRTQYKRRKQQPSAYDLDSVAAQGLSIAAFLLFMLGLATYSYGLANAYWLNLAIAPYVFLGVLAAGISLLPLRRYKNVWLTSLAVAFVFGGAFFWTVFNFAQLGTSLWGQQETRTFVLQEPLPLNLQDGERAPRFPQQIWLSEENGTKQPALRLEIFAELARQSYQTDDRIELSVRRGLFGQYVLNIEEADDHFRKNLSE